MSNIKTKATNYESPKTLNISEVKKISVNVEVFEKNGTKENGESFKYSAIEIDKKEYRMPVSVLKQLKVLLTEFPDLEFFKVNKTGSGMETEYFVIPLQK